MNAFTFKAVERDGTVTVETRDCPIDHAIETVLSISRDPNVIYGCHTATGANRLIWGDSATDADIECVRLAAIANRDALWAEYSAAATLARMILAEE